MNRTYQTTGTNQVPGRSGGFFIGPDDNPLNAVGREKGTFYFSSSLPAFFGSFLGRPRGRSEDSMPRRAAVRFVQTGVPNGRRRRGRTRTWRSSRRARRRARARPVGQGDILECH